MKACKSQIAEANVIVKNHADAAIKLLSNKSPRVAREMAKRINESQFFGEPLIQVTGKTAERMPIISVNKAAIEATVEKKIEEDMQKDLDERNRELKSGNNEGMFNDDMPTEKEMVNQDDFFNWPNVLANKMALKKSIEKKRDLEQNKTQTKDTLNQIEQYNEVIRRLQRDINSLQESDNLYTNYMDIVMGDIENIKMLLKNPSVENIQTIGDYINFLNAMSSLDTSTGFQPFLKTAAKNLDNYEGVEEIKKMQKDFNAAVKEVENLWNDEVSQLTRRLVRHHILNKDPFKDWDQLDLDEEVNRAIEAQFAKTGPNVDVNSTVAKVQKMEDQEDNNVFVSTIFRIYTDAIAMNNNKEKRKSLSLLQDKVKAKLIELGHTKGKGIFLKADESIFTRQDDTVHQLIGKYSIDWVKFEQNMKQNEKAMSVMLGKQVLSADNVAQIKKNFNKLNSNVDFLDITKVPEIIDNPDFAEFANQFNKEEAEAYKKELIARITEREYNKMVEEQKLKIYSYQIEKENSEARLREQLQINPDQNIEEFAMNNTVLYNAHKKRITTNNPFVFLANHKAGKKNLVAREFLFPSGEKGVREDFVDTKFISYMPKQGVEKYFDKQFESLIEAPGNEVLKEAWGHMADLVQYNNRNGFNKSPDNLTEYSLAATKERAVRLTGGPFDWFKILTVGTLNRIHSALSGNQYTDPTSKKSVSGAITTVDQKIETLFKRKIASFPEATNKKKAEVRAEAKTEVLQAMEGDLIENILATTELVETFKAKREAEAALTFIQNQLNLLQNRKNFSRVVNFFMDKKVYGINNRHNWLPIGSENAQMKFSSRFYTETEKAVRKESRAAIKYLKNIRNEVSDGQKVQIDKEIKAFEDYLKSGGKVITGGTILSFVIIKSVRFSVFAVNVKAQITNYLIGNTNAYEVDDKVGFWDAGEYSSARVFSRKFRRLRGGAEQDTGDALLQRLQLFQNSANELFIIEKGRAKNSIAAVAQNPMNFVSEVEKTIQRPQIYALMSQIKIKDKDGNEVKMFDSDGVHSDDISTFPAFEVENGELKLKDAFNTPENRATYIENSSQEYANLFGDGGHIPKKIAEINGDYRDSTSYLFEEKIYHAIPFLFKRWVVRTTEKKYNVVNRLVKNDPIAALTGLGVMGGIYGAATGFVAPMAIMGGYAAYAIYNNTGSRKRRERRENVDVAEAAAHLNLAKYVLKTGKRGGERFARIVAGVVAQTLQGVVRIPGMKVPYTKQLKRIVEMSDGKSTSGREFTEKEKREVAEDLHFLSTATAQTLKFFALRAIVSAMLAPDDEEYEEYLQLQRDKKTFWQRLGSAPDTTMYYLLENMLSGFINDNNMLFNTQAVVRADDIMGLQKTYRLFQAIEREAEGDGEYESGYNKGESIGWTTFKRIYMPAILKDGFSLGFGSSSKRDYDTGNMIDQMSKPILKKINKARKDAREETKTELEDEFDYIDNEDKRDKIVEKKLRKMYPVIKQKHLDSDMSHLWEDYYEGEVD